MQEKLIYHNPLSCSEDVKDFILEGDASIYFVNGKMRMENNVDPELGQISNFVLWCNKDFPSNIKVSWQFKPIREPGLAMFFFCAQGKDGKSIFDTSIAKREGIYKQYYEGDINTYHASYFRRKKQRKFNMCNLRKSYGFHMVASGADPIPSVRKLNRDYTIMVIKKGTEISLYIDDLLIFNWIDDGISYGSLLGEGKIGFRQMAPLIGEYSNLQVLELLDENIK
ncbi:MAG: YesU family protein [Vallitalea sp.]|jgi:hypothetical protein|nr:YesU family protein [Vallitalea sp.]